MDEDAVSVVSDRACRQRRARQPTTLEHPINLRDAHLIADLTADLAFGIDRGLPFEEPRGDRALAGIGHLVIDDNDGDVPATLVVTDEHFAAALASGVALDRQDRAPDPVCAGLTGSKSVTSLSRRRLVGVDLHPTLGSSTDHEFGDLRALRDRGILALLDAGVDGFRSRFPGKQPVQTHPMAASGQRPRIDDRELGRGVVNGTHDDEDYVLP